MLILSLLYRICYIFFYVRKNRLTTYHLIKNIFQLWNQYFAHFTFSTLFCLNRKQLPWNWKVSVGLCIFWKFLRKLLSTLAFQHHSIKLKYLSKLNTLKLEIIGARLCKLIVTISWYLLDNGIPSTQRPLQQIVVGGLPRIAQSELESQGRARRGTEADFLGHTNRLSLAPELILPLWIAFSSGTKCNVSALVSTCYF